jgi:DNA-binding IclR family transcriptional regulator
VDVRSLRGKEGGGMSVKYVDVYADVVACLTKKPRTCAELCELSGLGRVAMGKLLNALDREGVVRRSNPKTERTAPGPRAYLWEWNA